jgi:hypothetical protein
MKLSQRSVSCAIFGVIAAICVSASNVRADILYQQSPSADSSDAVSQTFTDFPDFSTYQFDDFMIEGTTWTVTKVTINGEDHGDPRFNTGVKLAFTTVADFASVTTTYDGVQDQMGNLVFDNLNISLGAGTHWITAWVERSFADGGQWCWFRTNEDGGVVGSEEYFHNPGGGFGSGMDPIPGSMVFGTPADLAFTIEGTTGG